MIQRIALLLLFLVGSITGWSQSGWIEGKVVDENKEPVLGAVVRVYAASIAKGGAVSDVDGNYVIKPLEAGRYEVEVSYTGYNKNVTTGVIVTAGKASLVRSKLEVSKANSLAERTIVANKYSAPHDAYIQRFPNVNTESYKNAPENNFNTVKNDPLSTMSVDVDRASYSNVRRFLNEGSKPPEDAVRIEEMVNYFNYDYPQPQGADPIAIVTELTDCPWQKGHKLLRIGMQARKIDMEKLPPSNIVFLIDVSGSMYSSNKLPLLKAAFSLLVDNLREKDRVSIVVYAGSAGLVLEPTPGSNKAKIKDALEKLQAGGSTAGGEGILLAYNTAQEHFIKGGNNRVILATDGDFNVGISGENDLEALITKEKEKGIFLTCLGFGMGNYKDSKMEVLADKGNGNYAYIDNIQEAQKTLVSEFGGTLFTVAKDVKAQIEFNPAYVQGYRLVGYENRVLNTEDFKDDKKDAGDMGSGHSVTILYEIIPVGVKSEYLKDSVGLKYQQTAATEDSRTGEFATIKFRYKKPDEDKSKEMVHAIPNKTKELSSATPDTRFSFAVAMFGMLLKNSKYKGSADYKDVVLLAQAAKGDDKEGYRSEFIRLAKTVK